MKKPSGSLAILALGKNPKGDMEEGEDPAAMSPKDDESSDYDSGGSIAFDNLADAMSIPEDKRAGAEAALKAYVKECMESTDEE